MSAMLQPWTALFHICCTADTPQVAPEWVGLFNEAELQMLISGREEGGSGGGIDLNDLRAHTEYSGEQCRLAVGR
jgi:hypothetical protein